MTKRTKNVLKVALGILIVWLVFMAAIIWVNYPVKVANATVCDTGTVNTRGPNTVMEQMTNALPPHQNLTRLTQTVTWKWAANCPGKIKSIRWTQAHWENGCLLCFWNFVRYSKPEVTHGMWTIASGARVAYTQRKIGALFRVCPSPAPCREHWLYVWQRVSGVSAFNGGYASGGSGP